MEQRSRKLDIDLLKTLAIFGVIVIHTFTAGGYTLGTAPWYEALFWGILVRSSVPIFFMCSGALLLDPEKELPLRRLYLHNILKIILAMLVWSMVYKVYHGILDQSLSPAYLWQSLKEVLLFNQEFHFYYLHITLLVYAFLPLTRQLCRGSGRQLAYILLLWFLLGIAWPTARSFWPFRLIEGVPVQWAMSLSYCAIGYGILGYAIRRYPQPKVLYWICATAGFLMMFIGTCVVSLRDGALSGLFLNGNTLGPALLAIGVYGICTGLSQPTLARLSPVTIRVSKASFCIFLVHVILRDSFVRWGLHSLPIPALLLVPLISLLNLVLCFLIYCLLSRIPLVRRYLV
jgi:surface polysaccharide O-acyltransferase-like enzyme